MSKAYDKYLQQESLLWNEIMDHETTTGFLEENSENLEDYSDEEDGYE